jgi:hypothetical protein
MEKSSMINEEEIPNDNINKNGEDSLRIANVMNNTPGKIKPVNAKYTNDTERRLINDTNRIIDDLISKFIEVRQNPDARMYIRKLMNTPRNILNTLKSSKEETEMFKKVFGNNTYKNLMSLPVFISIINNSNERRKKDGVKGSGYIDFSKEIEKLKQKFDKFFDKRLVSVYTEEMNYFNY